MFCDRGEVSGAPSGVAGARRELFGPRGELVRRSSEAARLFVDVFRGPRERFAS